MTSLGMDPSTPPNHLVGYRCVQSIIWLWNCNTEFYDLVIHSVTEAGSWITGAHPSVGRYDAPGSG